MHVLIDKTLMGINQQHHHIGIFNRLQGLYDGEFLHRLGNIFTASDTRSINQRIGFSIPLIVDINAVAGGAGQIKDNDAILTKQAVYQGGFTHIGTTDNGNLDAPLYIGLDRLL